MGHLRTHFDDWSRYFLELVMNINRTKNYVDWLSFDMILEHISIEEKRITTVDWYPINPFYLHINVFQNHIKLFKEKIKRKTYHHQISLVSFFFFFLCVGGGEVKVV